MLKVFSWTALVPSTGIPGSGCGLLGHIPAGKGEDGYMILQRSRKDLHPFDAEVNGSRMLRQA